MIGLDYLLPTAVFFGNLSSNGALAQLGERLHGMQEVEGSNPLGSIFRSVLHSGRAVISTSARGLFLRLLILL